MIVVLTGGTGGAKLIEGIAAEIDPADLTIICNTADDCVFYGLYVSPDIDTITYTLAGMIDPAKGWGIKNDTFAALEQLRRLGDDAWFQLGDKDLATHIMRTRLLKEGHRLSEVAGKVSRRLGVQATILPMSDERIETRIVMPQGEISFQEYFVKYHWARDVKTVRFVGAEQSKPGPGVIDAIERAEAIVICPSNPITSIGPILAVPGIRSALTEARAPVVAVSPIIGMAAISGPAHKLMIACGKEASALGVAECYDDFLDKLMMADEDRGLVSQIEKLHIEVILTDIRMRSLADKRRLALEVLDLAKK
ncbi:MAG TPA: 2-phospho-L-lactate transferase [Candidatus Binatia bacterium]|jgi:LPPG:FO 2-phospho-L-lactate transferase|nr:2-phospho-L-lactate transferase [Candidatus Binatia bacterium]